MDLSESARPVVRWGLNEPSSMIPVSNPPTHKFPWKLSHWFGCGAPLRLCSCSNQSRWLWQSGVAPRLLVPPDGLPDGSISHQPRLRGPSRCAYRSVVVTNSYGRVASLMPQSCSNGRVWRQRRGGGGFIGRVDLNSAARMEDVKRDDLE